MASVQATEIVIPALAGPDVSDFDLALCPVRALREYLNRTKSFRKGRKGLFIHFDPDRKTNLRTFHISLWLRQTITEAYHEHSDLSVDQQEPMR